MNRGAFDVKGLAVHSVADLGFFDRLWSNFKKHHSLLVIGCAGVGKTTLISSLHELSLQVTDRLSRTVSIETTGISIAGQIFDFIDTPAQSSYGQPDLMIRLAQQNLAGILNVVSYGYHVNSTESSKAVDPSGNVQQAYLQIHREREIDMLQKWMPFFETSPNTKLLTVVTKADLWWSDRERVFAHYRDGDYARALGRFRSAQIAVAGFSAVWKKFYKTVPLDPTFDQHAAFDLRANLLSLLLSWAATDKA